MNVVITGSTRGIGYALAEEFLQFGHNVMINGRDRMKCAEIYRHLHGKYPDNLIHIYACDVTCYNSVDRMYWEANRYFGSVDIWINNAGMTQEREYFYNLEKSNIDQVVDLNIKGVIYGTMVATKNMLKSGGYIYNMEGYGSNNMMTNYMTIYGTTKRALTYYTKSASKEVKNSGVKIGTLSPGMVITDLLLSGITTEKEERDKTVKLYNILADKPETVAKFLVKKMLQNNKNGASISWLTSRKLFSRFLLNLFKKRELI